MRISNSILSIALSSGLLLWGCQKEPLTEPGSAMSDLSSMVVKFHTKEAYLNYLATATEFFSSPGQSIDSRMSAVNFDIDSVVISNELNRYELWEESQLFHENVNTVYSNYVQLLKNGNIDEWNETAKQFPEFYYVDVNNGFNLKHTHLISSIINLQGVFIIGDKLYQYTNNKLNIYEPSAYQVVDGVFNTRTPSISIDNGHSRTYVPVYDDLHYVGFDQDYQYRMRIKGAMDVVDIVAYFELYGAIVSYPQRRPIADPQWYSFAPKEQVVRLGYDHEPFDVLTATFNNSTSSWTSGHIGNFLPWEHKIVHANASMYIGTTGTTYAIPELYWEW